MLDHLRDGGHDATGRIWPSDGVTRVPYWIFQDRASTPPNRSASFRDRRGTISAYQSK